VKIVELLLELLPHTVDTFHNKDRFFEEYGDQDEGGGNENENDAEYRNNKSEWEKIFAEGNNDDAFQIGISLSRKALRFYSEYHHADIILASPLGLRQQLGDEVAEIASKQRLSSDFLSSIEVCVIDSASVIMMQNLDHLRSILSAVNLQPGEASKADFSRIREWNLSFFAKYFRQTILFAHGIEPSLNNLMNKSCSNFGGMIRYMRKYDTSDGSCSITSVVPQVKQIFQRIDVGHSSMTLEEETDARFEYFKKNIFEPLLEQQKKHLLIFIPSYFDYVRIRNLFGENKKLIRFVNCCEYTQNKEISRSRSAFYHGKANAMLFTERFHFYRQYRIRGVHQIVWYGVPCIGDFYPDMLNMLGGSGTSEEEMSSIALFSKFDLYRMQRIVGGKRAQRMCNPSAKKPTYLFC
jgi:U3 small nucleolar RNA-associated protein 25